LPATDFSFLTCRVAANIATCDLGGQQRQKQRAKKKYNYRTSLSINMALVEDAASVLEQFIQDGRSAVCYHNMTYVSG